MANKRTDEELEKLKHANIEKIKLENANEVFSTAKNSLLQQIKKLDVNDETQVEDFYLTGLQLLRASNFILAKKRAVEKNTSFEKAFIDIGFDDVVSFLINVFKRNIHQHHFAKIKVIEEKYKPGTQEWAQMHSYWLTVATGLLEKPQILRLTKMIEEKVSFLKIKAKEFKKNGNTDSLRAVNNLLENIQKYTKKYLDDSNGVNFIVNINSTVARARPFLERQSWWKELIDDIANTIVNLIRREAFHIRFSLFANPAKENLDELQASITPCLDSGLAHQNEC